MFQIILHNVTALQKYQSGLSFSQCEIGILCTFSVYVDISGLPVNDSSLQMVSKGGKNCLCNIKSKYNNFLFSAGSSGYTVGIIL